MSDASLQPRAPLPPEDVARLFELARVVKAATRAVSLYPAAHPAIAETLRRVVDLTSAEALPSPLKITVLADGLLLDARALPRADGAVTELADLLHSHLVGELTVHPGGDVDAWRELLLLLGRPPDQLRAEGGLGQAWAAVPGVHVEVREIDYAEVLRERAGGERAQWDRILAHCLEGEAHSLDERDARALVDIACDAPRLTELLRELDGHSSRAATEPDNGSAALRLVRQIMSAAETYSPEQLESVLQNVARALGALSPETLLRLLSEDSGERDEEHDIMPAIVRRMSDDTLAQFVAHTVVEATAPTEQLADVFQALVGAPEARRRVLDLAHATVVDTPLGGTEGFEGAWQQIADTLLGSPESQASGSSDYARELSATRTRAITVEHAGSDPPERISAWLTTVEPTALRGHDLALVLDLLRIEPEDDRWDELMAPIVALLEDLLLVGDFDAARAIVDTLVAQAAKGGTTRRRQSAVTAMDLLVAGPMMRSVSTHLATVDDAQFDQVKAICVSLGEVLVKPLAEALSGEEDERARDRLTAIVLAFGPIGRRTVERLKGSPNVAVRRTAIHLLREFGGDEALPELEELLNDKEPQVQREAVRAILNIGTERACQILEQALSSGTAVSRDAIMQAMVGMRRERAAPLFAYVLRHTDHRGPMGAVYLRAIESLGMLRDPSGISSLGEALHRGEWWAPRRSARLRAAAAAALARIGTPEARTVLEEAATRGSRGVRRAARQHHRAAAGARAAQEKRTS